MSERRTQRLAAETPLLQSVLTSAGGPEAAVPRWCNNPVWSQLEPRILAFAEPRSDWGVANGSPEASIAPQEMVEGAREGTRSWSGVEKCRTVWKHESGTAIDGRKRQANVPDQVQSGRKNSPAPDACIEDVERITFIHVHAPDPLKFPRSLTPPAEDAEEATVLRKDLNVVGGLCGRYVEPVGAHHDERGITDEGRTIILPERGEVLELDPAFGAHRFRADRFL